MPTTIRPGTQAENTCSFCLYLQLLPRLNRRALAGNCTYHKEWIAKANRTTCSEMSNKTLAKGIYELSEQGQGQWLYTRRTERLRPRLFLVR